MLGRLFISSVRARGTLLTSVRAPAIPVLRAPSRLCSTTPSNPPPTQQTSAPAPPQSPPQTPPQAPPQAPPQSASPPPPPVPSPAKPATPAAPAASPINPDLPVPPAFENVIAERRGRVGLVRLNRPKQLNALSDALVKDITNALLWFQEDKDVGAMVITGSDKAFAAGADIREMEKKTYHECFKTNMLAQWQDIATKVRKPVIAAVNGFALGGGCELAMMCDIIIAGETAMFGQPEIRLGTIPGCGGTQRLLRAIGKSKAMELILTGNQMTAHDAEKAGLVSRVVPAEKLVDEAVRVASKISSFSQPIVALAKETVNMAYELNLQQGIHFERRMFHATFATADQKEGMNAFVEKRDPSWKNE